MLKNGQTHFKNLAVSAFGLNTKICRANADTVSLLKYVWPFSNICMKSINESN